MSDKSLKTKEKTTSGGWFRRNIPKVVIILAAIGAIFAVKKLPKQQRQAAPTEAPPVNVTIMPVVAEPELADTFDLPAIIEPNKIVTVSAEIEARVERIPLVEGSAVHTGDLLVQLNGRMDTLELTTITGCAIKQARMYSTTSMPVVDADIFFT